MGNGYARNCPTGTALRASVGRADVVRVLVRQPIAEHRPRCSPRLQIHTGADGALSCVGNGTTWTKPITVWRGQTFQGEAGSKSGDAKTLTYEFTSDRTGQVVATYLHFDPNTAAGGNVTFTLGVGVEMLRQGRLAPGFGFGGKTG